MEAANLLRHPIWRGQEVADAGDQPVLLIPGFLAGDGSLGLMTSWLRRTGHYTRRAGIRANVNCSEAAMEPLVARLEQMAEQHGRRVAVVGQSRGGNFAKVLARRRPDLVSGIVTLGSPQLDPLAVNPVVLAGVGAVGLLGTLGAPGLFRRACLAGDCCTTFWSDFRGELPRGVDYVCVYSRHDGIVDWHACLDPHAREHVEVGSSHCGMAVSPAVYRTVADALAAFRKSDARRSRSRRRHVAPLAEAA